MKHKSKRQLKKHYKYRTNTKKLPKSITVTASTPTQTDKVADWRVVIAELHALADSLNLLEKFGVTVELAHGAVVTDAGYVLAIGGEAEDAKWQVRTRRLTEFTPEPFTYDEDD